MTTTNDVHPMVMKAAKAQFACDCSRSADDHPECWEHFRDAYVRDAQRVLTECGALECLEALKRLRGEWAYQCSKGNVPEGRVEAEMADKAIAEVYGSAP
ncbi:MAG: hypothetical protein ACK5PG_05910 [Lysobacterales bacterium]|jgi:hypothetical protein